MSVNDKKQLSNLTSFVWLDRHSHSQTLSLLGTYRLEIISARPERVLYIHMAIVYLTAYCAPKFIQFMLCSIQVQSLTIA